MPNEGERLLEAVKEARDRLATRLRALLLDREPFRHRRDKSRWVDAAIARYLDSWIARAESALLFQHAVSGDDVRQAREYLACADHDLRLCSLLSAAGEWADSVYHLEQAVEKAASALVIGSGIVEPDDRLIHGHNIPQRVLIMFKEDESRTFVRMTNAITGSDYSAGLKKVNRLLNEDAEKIRRWGAPELKAMLQALQLFHEKTLAGRDVDELEDEARHILAAELPEYADQIFESRAANWAAGMHAAVAAYILGTTLFVHENSARYPGYVIGPSDYDSRLGVVKAFEPLFAEARRLVESSRLAVEAAAHG